MPNDWNDNDIKEIIINPVYTGIGKYPKQIDDKTYIEAAKQYIKEHGIEDYFTKMLSNLRKSFQTLDKSEF